MVRGAGGVAAPLAPGEGRQLLRVAPLAADAPLAAGPSCEVEAVLLASAGAAGPVGQRPAAGRGPLRPLAALLALSALALAAPVVRWRRGAGRAWRQALGDAVVFEGGSGCIIEDDVDYWTHRSLSQEKKVWSAEGCRDRCEVHPKCGAWTWGKARHQEGLTDMCFLMQLEPGLLPNKTRRAGVTSGLPCNKTLDNSFDQVAVERWLASMHDSSAMGLDPTVAAVVSSSSTTAAAAEDTAYLVALAPATASSDKGRAPAGTTTETGSVGGLDPTSKSTCGPVEEDVTYWVWSLLGEMHNVPTARQCQEKCASVRGCGAWTWGKARDVADLSDICFLKGQADELQDRRHHARGVSSGLCGVHPASARMAIVLAPGDGRGAGWSNTVVPPPSPSWSSTRSPLVRTITTATTTLTSATTITSVLTSSTTSETSRTHTKTTSTETASSSTTTMAPIVLPEKADGELFCFSVMLPDSEEQSLIVIAFQNNASIFQCDKSTVYSSQEFEVAPGVVTHRVASDLHCETGGEFNTALNLGIFLEVWRQVVRDGDFARFEWTVKLDPDSVFFPDRLRTAVKNHPLADHELGVYLNNCQFGLHGPIEVFSRHAVKTWWDGSQRCLDHFWEVCQGDCLWGEDLFIDQCLWKVLGAHREDEYALLIEDHCSPPEGWRNCEDSWPVAFHPFKSGWEWMQCFENSKAHQA